MLMYVSCTYQNDMVILTDDQRDSKFVPTRQNMIAAMQWLVRDAAPNDSYVSLCLP